MDRKDKSNPKQDLNSDLVSLRNYVQHEDVRLSVMGIVEECGVDEPSSNLVCCVHFCTNDFEEVCLHLFCSQLWLRRQGSLALDDRRKEAEKANSEFQTAENAVGYHSIVFLKNTWKFTNNKEISVENNDHLRPERT